MIRRRNLPSFAALQAFESAARHGSFTRAAEELHLTQGAVSRQVRGLEHALGVSLFELVRQRVVLTELGKRYLLDVRRMLDALETSTRRTMALGRGSDTLDLATLPTFCSRWLIPRLPALYLQHPNLSINCSTRMLPFDFAEEPFDAAIHFGAPAWSNGVLHHLFPERMLAVCSPEFRTKFGIRSDADLSDAPLLQQSTRGGAWAEWFAAANVKVANPEHGPRFDQFSMLANAAMAGLGVALLPEFLIEEEVEAGRLVVAAQQVLKTDQAYYLVLPEARSSGPTIDSFRRWILGEAERFRAATAGAGRAA
jgi:LysR family glycine cleavage system transcriptional activator